MLKPVIRKHSREKSPLCSLKTGFYFMAKKRYITTDFWRDNFVDEIDPIEKLLFLYLICNPATNLCGIYKLPLRIIDYDTCIDSRALENIFAKFSSKKKAYFLDGWVVLPNAPKHLDISNIKISSGIKRELSQINEEIFKNIKDLDIPYIYPMDSPSQSELSYSKVKFSSEDLVSAKLLYNLIKENNPAWYVEPNWNQWEEDMRKIRELDKRTKEQIEYIIKWAQNDKFWKTNILSPSKLRKQFNTLVVQAKSKSENKRDVIL